MKKNCKNCTYLYAFQRNLWCTRQLQHTEADGCCKEFKRKQRINSSLVALILAAIAFVLSVARLIQTLL